MFFLSFGTEVQNFRSSAARPGDNCPTRCLIDSRAVSCDVAYLKNTGDTLVQCIRCFQRYTTRKMGPCTVRTPFLVILYRKKPSRKKQNKNCFAVISYFESSMCFSSIPLPAVAPSALLGSTTVSMLNVLCHTFLGILLIVRSVVLEVCALGVSNVTVSVKNVYHSAVRLIYLKRNFFRLKNNSPNSSHNQSAYCRRFQS